MQRWFWTSTTCNCNMFFQHNSVKIPQCFYLGIGLWPWTITKCDEDIFLPISRPEWTLSWLGGLNSSLWSDFWSDYCWRSVASASRCNCRENRSPQFHMEWRQWADLQKLQAYCLVSKKEGLENIKKISKNIWFITIFTSFNHYNKRI